MVIETTITVESETFIIGTCVPMTKRQIRQIKRDLRNGTHFIFDRHVPPITRAGMHRMKGAKQAYERRPKSWADIEGMTHDT